MLFNSAFTYNNESSVVEIEKSTRNIQKHRQISGSSKPKVKRSVKLKTRIKEYT